MTVKMEVIGVEKAKAYLNFKKNKTKVQEVVGLNRAAIYVQGEVKESIAGRRAEPASVDTGRFLNSVEFEVGLDDAVIFSQVPYAGFLEYGTSRFKPRSHFRNTKSRSKQKVAELLNEEIKKI